MKTSRLIIGFVALIALVVASAYLLAVAGKAQTIAQQIKPDVTRALKAAQHKGPHTRKNSYQPSRNASQLALRPRTVAQGERQLARVAQKRDSDDSCSNYWRYCANECASHISAQHDVVSRN